MEDFIAKCDANEMFDKLYYDFNLKKAFLFIGESNEKMMSAINETADYFGRKIISLDLQVCGEEPVKYENWNEEMWQHPENEYVLVFEHFEKASPRMRNWISRVAKNVGRDRKFVLAVLYTRQSPDENVRETIGDAVYSPLRPKIDWKD